MEGLTTTTTIIIAEQSFALMIDGKLYHPTTLNRLRTTETGGSLDSAKLRMKSDRSIDLAIDKKKGHAGDNRVTRRTKTCLITQVYHHIYAIEVFNSGTSH